MLFRSLHAVHKVNAIRLYHIASVFGSTICRALIQVQRSVRVHRRARPVPARPELEDPGRPGRTGDPLYGGDRPAWDCRCVYVIPSGDRSGRTRKSGTPVLSGTIDRSNLVRRLAALQLFSDGSYRVCVHSDNGGADEVERNYGSFSDFTCIPVIADVED